VASSFGPRCSTAGDLVSIRRTYLVEEYRRDAVNQNVGAAVHVEVGWDHDDDALAEIRWLETLDKSSGVAVCYIGYAELTAP
jgi:predicted TIM-barrel fold metal-dependent hydrolase